MLVVQPLVWSSFDEFISVFEDNLRQMFGEEADLRQTLFDRYGSWDAFRDEQSGVERWRDLADSPERMTLEVVRCSAQFVMDDRPEACGRFLSDWIAGTVEEGRSRGE